MSNWATLFRQPTRLPVAADPFAEQFHCERYACKLTRTGCVNRFNLAQGSTRDGISERAMLYGGCRNCLVGKAHARGEPTPENQFETEVTMEAVAASAGEVKQYAERMCRRGMHMFMPTSARERACPDLECKSRSEQSGIVTKPPPSRKNGKHHNGRLSRRRATPAELERATPKLGSEVVSKPAKHGAVPQGVRTSPGSPEDLLELSSPVEVLQLAGFTVRSVRTRGGILLQVT